ncbi:uncharacterized protein CEXT_541111 [Caerostris extrusa]|nr:uncharacterized protein CEXT_541111 [Caerostris extrusa]
MEMAVPPPLGGYSYPAPAASTSSFSSSIEYPQQPYMPAASQAYAAPPMPFAGAPASAGYMGFEPQPMVLAPPMGL